MKYMVKMGNKINGAIMYTVLQYRDSAEKFVALVEENEGCYANAYEAGKMPFEELPAEVQDQVKETLKAFSECNVRYENGEFHVLTCSILAAEYAFDEMVVGRYYAKNIYTEEERRKNYAELCAY